MDTEYILVTTGSAGDLFPFLRMACTLRERGHRVRLVGPDMHGPAVAQTGIAFHGTFADPAVLDDKDLWHPVRGFGVVWRAVRPGLRELPQIVEQVYAAQAPASCVIVAHPLALPDAILMRDQRTRFPGMRVVAVYLAPSNLPTVHDPLMLGPYRVPRWVPHGMRRWLWRLLAARLVDPVVLPELNADRQRAGLAPVASLFDLMRGAPDLSVTLFPPWFGPRQPDWPQPLAQGDFALFDPNPQLEFPPEAQAFFAAGAAPLLFTYGTGNRQARQFFAHAIAAAQALGRRAVLLTPHRDQLPPSLPPHVLWQAYLPLRQCLRHAALIAHHGGIGTTAEAISAAVPQLIVPMAFDQFDNGARVQALGVGAILAGRLDTALMTTALADLLHKSAAPALQQIDNGQRWDAMIDAIARK